LSIWLAELLEVEVEVDAVLLVVAGPAAVPVFLGAIAVDDRVSGCFIVAVIGSLVAAVEESVPAVEMLQVVVLVGP
jgi:hypothetical protein